MKAYQEPEMIIYGTAFEVITDDTPLDSGLGIE